MENIACDGADRPPWSVPIMDLRMSLAVFRPFWFSAIAAMALSFSNVLAIAFGLIC
jgi:hypothetical protein